MENPISVGAIAPFFLSSHFFHSKGPRDLKDLRVARLCSIDDVSSNSK